MKCEIIRDLLPAYCDCVCSIETAAEIESHVDGCADCKKLLDDYRSDIKPTGGAPEKPFRRISRKIFRNKLVIAALVILLAAVLGCVGYLTYGQFVREPNQPSFETIISSQKAKKLVKKFCEGDIDYVMENIELYQTGVALFDSRDEVREYCRTVLSDFYEKYLKGRNLNVKTNGYSGYTTIALKIGTSAATYVGIYDGQLELLDLCLVEYTGKKFIISPNGYSGNLGEDFDLCGKDVDTLRLALAPTEPTPLLETAIINNAANDSGNFNLFVNRFKETPEEKQAMADKAATFTEDMYCESAYYTNFRFDAENSRYLIDIGFTFSEKSSGKRVSYSRTVRLKSAAYRFEILPEFEPVIIDGGITAENLENLKKLFE